MPELVNLSSSAPAADGQEHYRDDVSIYEMDDNAQSPPAGAPTGSTAPTSTSAHNDIPAAMRGLGIAKHTLGLLLLLLVVFLWTTSNFLGSVGDPTLYGLCNHARLPLLTSLIVNIRRRHLCQTFLPDLSQRLDIHARHHCAHEPRRVDPMAKRLVGRASCRTKANIPPWRLACRDPRSWRRYAAGRT